MIIWFDDDRATDSTLVGGKGANLARLTAARFNVPAGFTVSTEAYHASLAALWPQIEAQLATIDGADANERATQAIRAAITATAVPTAVQQAIEDAYATVGGYVAVRSSGTAEDLADASFAGLHDTYLDITGADQVLDAVRRCWASMWTARAVAYRSDKGFDHAQARIAVVVQRMVESTVAGVLFTGNPLTTATDELVINASYGLGEGVVSGAVNPDEFTVLHDNLKIIDRKLGDKALKIVRDPAGTGTVEQPASAAERTAACLDDDQIQQLAALGRRVQEHYDELPQDIEWAYADGDFFLLQSRPITGVEFSWDADVDAWQTHDFDPDTTWTRAWADSNWTGAKTPLFYSLRAYSMTRGETWTNARRGLERTAQRPYLRYSKAEVYYNCDLDREVVLATTPKQFRALLPDLAFIPPAWREDLLDADFDLLGWLRMQARIALLGGQHAPHNCMVRCREYIADTSWHPRNLPDLEQQSDRELRRMVRRFNEIEATYCEDVWFLFLQHARDALCVLPILLAKWYDPADPLIIHDLLAGTTRSSRTLIDNAGLWRLAERIRASDTLTAAFESHDGAGFFAAIKGTPDGDAFLAAYAEFLTDSGFRGHADRDLIFPRRLEDPEIDHRNFKTLLSATDPVDPVTREHEVNARREAAVKKVADVLRTQPLGEFRAAGFERLIAYIHDFIVLRDDQRWSLDRLTLSLKLTLSELARRARERGLLEGEDDHYFLSWLEFCELLDGQASMPLVRAKIAARRRDWERQENKQAGHPLFMRRGRPAPELLGTTPPAQDGDGPLQGIPTSRGTVTGTARVIATLTDIGRVQAGEILVCNSTDPGWTPVFTIVGGVVTETGGMLSHASCLSREYGLPSVQIADAMALITDGETITISGDTGQVLRAAAVPV